jgi:hypothetical protein
MPITVFVKSKGKVTLTDREYIGAGGEASVYKKDRIAYKIYHDPNKMIPVKKIQELQSLTPTNVLKPLDVIHNNNLPIGYIMPFVSDTNPVCKLFTKTFRDNNGLHPKDVAEIVKYIQTTVDQVHKDGCLIVDLNELNLLASSKFDTVFFIDVDSYQTKSYKATAIMESIKDPQVKSNHFTELSDWFSFGVIAIQLYIGIHPYKGRHPDYKPNEWARRMKDGVSIFDKDVGLPKTCYDFSVIPKTHLNWFQELFVKNNRSIPPLPGEALVIIPVEKYKVVQSTGDFDIKIVWDMGGVILYSYYYAGCEFLVSKNTIFCDEKVYRTHQMGKIGICDSGDELFPAICQLDDNKLKFFGPRDVEIEELHSDNFMMRNGCIYSVYDGKLTECSVAKLGSKYFLKTRLACNVSDLSTKVFEGVIFQDLLGKCYITLPFEIGRCIFNPIKELHGYRILDAKSERNIVVVLAEKKSTYYRFIITYDDKFNDYKIRKQDDVSFGSVNFTVKPNGVCILASDNEVEIFKDEKIKIVSNSPFDTDTKLFNRNGDIFFIDEKRVYSVRTK